MYEKFLDAIVFAVNEAQHNMTNASITVFKTSLGISLRFQLSSRAGCCKVNLFPSIRVNGSCTNYKSLLKTFSRVPKTVLEECCVEQGIHVVAKPAVASAGEESFWSITFNDIEKRVIFSERFECGKDTLLRLYNDLKNTLNKEKQLSHYQIRAFVLLEIFRKPKEKAWRRKCLQKRLVGVMKSLEIGLQNGRCPHVFTGVNLFAGMTQEVLSKISSEIHYCE